MIHSLFDTAHFFSRPLHAATIDFYSAKNLPRLHQRIARYAKSFFLFAAGTPFALLSVLCSSAASIAMSLTGKKYLITSYGVRSNDKMTQCRRILTYNVGLLPGIGVITAYHNPEERENVLSRISNFIIEQFKSHDLIVMQEAVSRDFIQLLESELKDRCTPFVLYSRIGNPLYPGICSGVAVLAKQHLSAFRVKQLKSDWFFSRAAACFVVQAEKAPYEIVTTHLSTGEENDSKRESQLNQLFNCLDQRRALFIGDYNFSNQNSYNLSNHQQRIGAYYWKNEISFNTCDENSHPDLVAAYWHRNEQPLYAEAQIVPDLEETAYDHVPISVNVSENPIP